MKRLLLLLVLIVVLVSPVLAVIPGYIPDGDFQITIWRNHWKGINLGAFDRVECGEARDCVFQFLEGVGERHYYRAIAEPIEVGELTLSARVSAVNLAADTAYVRLVLSDAPGRADTVLLPLPAGTYTNQMISLDFESPGYDFAWVFIEVIEDAPSSRAFFDNVSLQ